MNEIYDTDWKLKLAALIQRARDSRQWLHCSYQDLWFSPDELQEHHKKGSFMWAAPNWTLRDPSERLREADRRVQNAINARNKIAEQIS